ncbi:MAG: cytochrome c3 family protein [Thermoanaerobaculia bacterium]
MSRSRKSWMVLCLVSVGLLFGVSKASSQLRPGQEIDQKEVCLGCHDLEDALGARVQHAPVESGECTACHNPHVARHGALLREQTGALCAGCHGEVSGKQDRPVVHLPVAEGRCAECHEPHGSPHRGLLVDQSQDLCTTCHDEIGSWRDRSVQHPPFAQGRCSACHDPHSSTDPGLLHASGAAICTKCHQTGDSFSSAHRGYPVNRASCHQCHEPHASAQSGLFRESVHAPFESGNCRTCHPGPGAASPFSTIKPMNELCGGCHESTVIESRQAAFPHVPAGGGECEVCHNPHTGDGGGLLRKEMQALCTECHNPGGAKSGEEGRHLTHQGFECTTCHQPHGGDQPLLFAADSVELCGRCHTHEHGVRHPLGEETRDPRTGNPMTCLSCHGIHESPGEFYLFEADQKMLCIGCHNELIGR